VLVPFLSKTGLRVESRGTSQADQRVGMEKGNSLFVIWELMACTTRLDRHFHGRQVRYIHLHRALLIGNLDPSLTWKLFIRMWKALVVLTPGFQWVTAQENRPAPSLICSID
jgi:hypothetical protein